jgi:hypothetical protein
MNVEQVIKAIKSRPGMHVGCLDLEPIFHYINGFMFNNTVSNNVDNVEAMFKERFDEWVRIRLEKAKNIKMEEHHCYLYYFKQVYPNPQERLDIFFGFCETFFREMPYAEGR